MRANIGLILLNRRAATRSTVTGVKRFTAEIIPRLHALALNRLPWSYPKTPEQVLHRADQAR